MFMMTNHGEKLIMLNDGWIKWWLMMVNDTWSMVVKNNHRCLVAEIPTVSFHKHRNIWYGDDEGTLKNPWRLPELLGVGHLWTIPHGSYLYQIDVGKIALYWDSLVGASMLVFRRVVDVYEVRCMSTVEQGSTQMGLEGFKLRWDLDNDKTLTFGRVRNLAKIHSQDSNGIRLSTQLDSKYRINTGRCS